MARPPPLGGAEAAWGCNLPSVLPLLNLAEGGLQLSQFVRQEAAGQQRLSLSARLPGHLLLGGRGRGLGHLCTAQGRTGRAQQQLASQKIAPRLHFSAGQTQVAVLVAPPPTVSAAPPLPTEGARSCARSSLGWEFERGRGRGCHCAQVEHLCCAICLGKWARVKRYVLILLSPSLRLRDRVCSILPDPSNSEPDGDDFSRSSRSPPEASGARIYIPAEGRGPGSGGPFLEALALAPGRRLRPACPSLLLCSRSRRGQPPASSSE